MKVEFKAIRAKDYQSHYFTCGPYLGALQPYQPCHRARFVTINSNPVLLEYHI